MTTFWEIYQPQIIVAIASFAVLVLLIIFLEATTRKLEAVRRTLRQHNANLESHVAERTAELSAANTALLAEVAERKQAEDALRESESRFRTLLQYLTSISVQGYAMDGTTQYWNQGSEHIYGYTAEEAIGRNLLELIIPTEMQEGVKGAIQHMAETGQPVPAGELSLMRQDGSRVAVYSSHAIVKPPGRAAELFCIDIDLTDLKRAETVLAESQALLHSIVESTTDMIWTIDTGTAGLLSFNQSFADFFEARGLHVEKGMLLKDIMPTDDSVKHWYALYQRALREGSFTTEYSVDAGKKILQVSFNRLERNGEVFGVSVFSKNITEHKLAEERVVQSEKKYRDLFQANRDGIAIFLILPGTQYSTFIEVNDAAPRMLGYTAAEMLALSPPALEPDVTEAEMQFRQAELQRRGVVTFETALRHKDGHSVHTEFSAQFFEYDGRPAIMNIVRDITERKQHEHESQAIATLSAALRFAPTRSDMLPAIIEQLVGLLHSDALTIEIIDLKTGDAVVEAAYGTWEHLLGSTQKKGTGINAIISETLQPYWTHDLQKDPNLFYHEWARAGIRGSAGVPLIVQEKLIGFIWMGRKTDIAEPEVRMLSAIADIAANAIHRATMHEQSLKAAADLVVAYDTTLAGWANALELREHETAGHSQRVVELTRNLAQPFGFSDEELMHVQRGALLHDIGKMGIPDYILLKPGPLSDDEWQIMRQHPVYAYDLLSKIPYLVPALDIPLYHHERWDGTGYPRGLKGDAIPLTARIFAVADVWDALTSNRPYRPAWTKDAVLKYLTGHAGTQFDPLVVERFLKMMNSW